MRRSFSVLVFLLLAVPLAGIGRSGGIPEVLYIGEDPYPAWVAAERALSPDGTVDPELFSETSRRTIARYFTVPPDGDCIRLGKVREIQTRISGPEKRADLADAIRNSDWVFTARVTAQGGGFYTELPGTLLEVVPVEVFKGPKKRVWNHYIFMPVGTFQVGGFKFCKTEPQYADLPEVGEEVFLLADLTWRNQRSDFLHTGLETGIITLHSTGEVSLPERYRRKNKALVDSSRSDFVRFVRQVLEEDN